MYFLWTYILLVAVQEGLGQHADCRKVRRIDPTFSPDKLEGGGSFENLHNRTALKWPEDLATPITFTLRTLAEGGGRADEGFRALVQISMTESDPMHGDLSGVMDEIVAAEEGDEDEHSGQLKLALERRALFNCHVDRSEDNPCPEGRENPRCCYNSDARLNNLQEKYPRCEHGCQRYGPGGSVLKQPCQAVCSHALVIHVEFSLNRNGTGGRTAVAAVYKQTKLLQSDEPFNYEFSSLGGTDRNPKYAEGSFIEEGSAVNSRVEMGFWIRWTPRKDSLGPFLEVGRDAESVPYMVHDFEKHCFNCESRDMHGWHMADVQSPLLLNIFRPRFWHVNAVQGHGVVEAGFDCGNVIYSTHQDQLWLDGPCIENGQCRDWCQTRSCLGRTCEVDREHFGGDLQWLGMKTCQIEATEEMPTYIVIILVLVGLIGLAAFFLLAMCLFYLGSIYPRKKRAAHTTVQAPNLHKKGEPVLLEEWEPQTLEEDQGAQAPTPFDMTGIPITVPYADESVLHDVRQDSIFSALANDEKNKRDRLFQTQKGKYPHWQDVRKKGIKKKPGGNIEVNVQRDRGIPVVATGGTDKGKKKRTTTSASETESTTGSGSGSGSTSTDSDSTTGGPTTSSTSRARCACKDTCSTRKCKCRDADVRCGARCHGTNINKCSNL